MIHIYKELNYRDEKIFNEIESMILSLNNDDWPEIETVKVPEWVNKAKAYLLENWNKPISLDDLVQVCCVHKVTISKYTAKYLGSTVLKYQRKIRIIKAIELIKTEKYSLTEIAFLCGFADQSHFTRFFRQAMGYIPKQCQRHER